MRRARRDDGLDAPGTREEDPDMSPGSAAPEGRNIGLAGAAAFSAIFWPYLLGSSALLFAPAVGIFLATAPFDSRRRLLGRFTAEWGAHYLERAPFAKVEVFGREKVDELRPAIYVANHQSMSDTLALFSARIPALWVSKVENFYAPFLGWNMALNRFIPVKRGHLPSIMRMYRTCIRRLSEGHSLVVFPEGTRSDDGNLRHFFRGAFSLSVRANVPIVPVVLDGTGDLLKKGSMLITPCGVRVSILDPIDPASAKHDSNELRERVKSTMAAELVRLREARKRAR